MITTVPTNTTVLRDSAVLLTCNADANPSVHTYHFYFNGNLIGNSSSGVFNISVKEDGDINLDNIFGLHVSLSLQLCLHKFFNNLM